MDAGRIYLFDLGMGLWGIWERGRDSLSFLHSETSVEASSSMRSGVRPGCGILSACGMPCHRAAKSIFLNRLVVNILPHTAELSQGCHGTPDEA